MINRRKAIIATQVLNGGTLEAIGKRHGITKGRVRQILKEVVHTVYPKLIYLCKQNNMGRRGRPLTITPCLRSFDIAHSRELSRLIVNNTEPDPNNSNPWLDMLAQAIWIETPLAAPYR